MVGAGMVSLKGCVRLVSAFFSLSLLGSVFSALNSRLCRLGSFVSALSFRVMRIQKIQVTHVLIPPLTLTLSLTLFHSSCFVLSRIVDVWSFGIVSKSSPSLNPNPNPKPNSSSSLNPNPNPNPNPNTYTTTLVTLTLTLALSLIISSFEFAIACTFFLFPIEGPCRNGNKERTIL
jgi:hypothetical protein